MMKYINLLLPILLIGIAFIMRDDLRLSTNLLSLFSSKEDLKKFEIANELGYTKELLIGVEGFDKDAKENADSIAKALQTLPYIRSVEFRTSPAKEIQNYYKKHYLLLSDFNNTKLTKDQIRNNLVQLYEDKLNSFFYTAIDTHDPLKLFTLDLPRSNFETLGGYLTLKEYGYFIYVQTTIDPSQMQDASKAYKEIKQILKHYPKTHAFAGFFYTVENSTKIKQDVSIIILLSTFMLLLLYLYFLRNAKLLLHVLSTLGASALFATLVSISFFENFHILSLAFGASVSAISIDYLFHYYLHRFYTQNKTIDTNVFYGFFTTASAFLVLCFIPITLIAQISFFTLISLMFSYFVFTFIYRYIDFKEYSQKEKNSIKTAFISTPIALLCSSVFLGSIFFTFSFDTNIRNLDFQNTKLMQEESFFKEKLSQTLSPVIVEGDSKTKLIQNLEKLKQTQVQSFSLASFIPSQEECNKRKERLLDYDFIALHEQFIDLAQEIGFSPNYFKDAYLITKKGLECKELLKLEAFLSYRLSILSKENKFYTLAFVQDLQKAKEYTFVSLLDAKMLFAKIAEEMLESLKLFGAFIGILIIFFLFISVKKRFFYAINYILLPLSVSLGIVSLFYEINIMHLFASIILVALGIDYGIYMSNTTKKQITARAIDYSLLSTFGAFGVLIFSSITALHSIGIVITLGVGILYILTKVLK